MGCRSREFSGEEAAVSASLGDALLFTTMCIVGLPVDVHAKDGSIYSGTFHTASVDNDYGVVLKDARMIKKGKCDANVAREDLIETLVILPEDLVQVVAKEIMLPACNYAANSRRDIMGTVNQAQSAGRERRSKSSNKTDVDRVEAVWTRRRLPQTGSGITNGFIPTTTHDIGNCSEVESEEIKGMHFVKKEEASNAPMNARQVRDGILQGKELDYEGIVSQKEEDASGVQGSSPSLDACFTQSNAAEEYPVNAFELLPNVTSSNGLASSTIKLDNKYQERPISGDSSCSNTISSDVSVSGTSFMDGCTGSSVCSSPAPTIDAPQRRSSSTTKEFKLNPGAKVFCPSFSNRRSVTPPAVPTAANVAYAPDNFPVVPIATAEPEVEFSSFVPHSSPPVKIIPSGNLIAGNGITDSQFSQTIVGQAGSRTLPLRYAGQYHTIQGLPTYLHPNYQNVMVGRLGQLVYMHPVSHDMNQGVTAIPQVPTCPILAPHSVHLPKHQGSAAAQTLPLSCVTPPLISAGGQQPFGVPGHASLPQPPFPVFHSIPVPGSNGICSTKLP